MKNAEHAVDGLEDGGSSAHSWPGSKNSTKNIENVGGAVESLRSTETTRQAEDRGMGSPESGSSTTAEGVLCNTESGNPCDDSWRSSNEERVPQQQQNYHT
uniref:Putative ATP-dependent RNA helicase DDX5 n=1 Tax=Lygus hesperus TaxID=30085 RepID=A0A0A9ZCZ4_LYGHE